MVVPFVSFFTARRILLESNSIRVVVDLLYRLSVRCITCYSGLFLAENSASVRCMSVRLFCRTSIQNDFPWATRTRPAYVFVGVFRGPIHFLGRIAMRSLRCCLLLPSSLSVLHKLVNAVTRLNRSSCRLGWTCWAQEPRIRWGPDPPTEKGTLRGHAWTCGRLLSRT